MKGRIRGTEGWTAINEDEDVVSASATQEVVFVSHRRTDLGAAEHVAECIASYGLRAYLDDKDPAVDGDRPGLIDYLLDVIRKSAGLIVVASAETAGSWWVPGEVFAAHGNGSRIGTYRLRSVALENLPSYLRHDWPIMVDHEGLHTWCERFKEAALYQKGNLLQENVDKVTGRDSGDFYSNFTDGVDGIRISRQR